jgi:MFS family permease
MLFVARDRRQRRVAASPTGLAPRRPAIHSSFVRPGTEQRAAGVQSALAFWLLALLLGFFLFAASAPSPLYGIYARILRLSPTTITTIYAVYAAGALGALVVTGRLADHIGRRPVVLIALVIQIGGMFAFIVADSTGALYLGRILQGVGTGIASGAISAWLVDLEPPDRPRLGSLLTGIALLAGLGTGGLVSAMLVQFGPDPLRFVFWLLAGIYGAAFFAIMVMPDVAPRSPGAIRSLRPRVSVPANARAQFWATTPTMIAIWALAGLYLSLGPALALSLGKTDNRVVGGAVIFALMGSGSVASAAVVRVAPRKLILRGSVLVVLGVALTLAAEAAGALAALYAGSLVAGLGLGPAFSGIVRSLGPLAPPERRGALFAAVYIVVYVAISAPTIAAGIASSRFGLEDTTYVYGGVVMVLATVTCAAVLRHKEPGAPKPA